MGKRHDACSPQLDGAAPTAVVINQVLQAGKGAEIRETVAIVGSQPVVIHYHAAWGAAVAGSNSCEHR